MYGLVNRAIEQMVTKNFGQSVWLELCAQAEVSPTTFVAQTAYDDSVTYKLVAIASDKLGIAAADILRAFGEFWILYTAQEGYGDLMDMCGDNLFDALEGMNDMHARIEMTFPDMRPPHFEIDRMSETAIDIRYFSQREGLAPMVDGLLRGLAKRFAQNISVEHTVARTIEQPVDQFHVQLL